MHTRPRPTARPAHRPAGTASHRAPPRRPFRGLCVLGVALLLCGPALPDDEPPTDVGKTRSILEQWVQTRRLISRERRDWALGKEMLTDRIELVQDQIDALRSRIEKTRADITEADESRAGLQATKQELDQATAALEDILVGLEARTRALLPRLPDPIRERVKPLSQRLPADPAETRLSLSERFQDVVGILNEVDKFDRDITTTSEVRTLPDGTTAEVTAVYVGIGQGYYVTANGAAAGVGTATADGWTWTPANEDAAAIAETIAILGNEQAADFVQLPVQIDG